MTVEGGRRVAGRKKQNSRSKPLVSIITVVYNNKKLIRRTIESVLNQDYENTEYLIIDGGSTDGTVDIIKEYEDKIDYFVSEKDNGIYNAMNKGIGKAKGELIGILNSDDWYEENIIKEIVTHYVEAPECIQYGLCRSHDDKGKYQVATFLASRLPEYMIAHPTCFVPKKLYLKHGLFDESYKIAGDYDLMLRFHTRGERFRFNEMIITNGTFGGICNNNPTISKREMIRARYNNGVISKKTYMKENLKVYVTEPMRRAKENIKRIVDK